MADNGDPSEPEFADVDVDGFTPCGGDCDDLSSTAHPGAVELCNGSDDDCDGAAPGEDDVDQDGWPACADCEPGDASIFPGGDEAAGTAVDEDCDGFVDEQIGVLWTSNALFVSAKYEVGGLGWGMERVSTPGGEEYWIGLPGAIAHVRGDEPGPITQVAHRVVPFEPPVGEYMFDWLSTITYEPAPVAWVGSGTFRQAWPETQQGVVRLSGDEDVGVVTELFEPLSPNGRVGPLVRRGPDLNGDGQPEILLGGLDELWWMLSPFDPIEDAELIPAAVLESYVPGRTMDLHEVLADCDVDGDGIGDVVYWANESYAIHAFGVLLGAEFPGYESGPAEWRAASSTEFQPDWGLNPPWRQMGCVEGLGLWGGKADDAAVVGIAGGAGLGWAHRTLYLLSLEQGPGKVGPNGWETGPPDLISLYEDEFWDGPELRLDRLCNPGDVNGDGADDIIVWEIGAGGTAALLSGRLLEGPLNTLGEAAVSVWTTPPGGFLDHVECMRAQSDLPAEAFLVGLMPGDDGPEWRIHPLTEGFTPASD